ncbi:response regulator [Methylobacterium sp. WL69]|uniref:response regulator n=1 Tax=Methylobacterium sp. WL69 TaxID=2603893 RepID=UPI0011C8AC00|nr:response regulator [Methylobacterium sp. WL69]TXM70275.1 response regulator [Methylobacterium sp. WL69]
MHRLRSSSPPYALVVEGHSLVRMDAVSILEGAGFRVLDVATGEEAMRLLDKHGAEFALLFTAVGLSGHYDGFALARKAASDHPHIGIVVASGHHMPAPGDLPDSACFIKKPFSADVVYNHLQRILPDDTKPEPLRSISEPLQG